MEAPLNAGAVFFGLVTWRKEKTFPPARKVPGCAFSGVCTCPALHSEPVEVSVQTPSAWRAAVPNIAVCTGASWSLIPALIPLDFVVSCPFQRRLLIDT